MKKQLNSNSNAVFSLKYHLIINVKYRRSVFDNPQLLDRCKEIISETIKENDAELLSIECGSDHVHILISAKPTTSLTKLINVIKGRSSRILRKEFTTYLQDKLWGKSFWSPSYYIATTGNVSLDTLIKYVESQREGM